MRLVPIPNATRVGLSSLVETSIRPEDTTRFADACVSSGALAKLAIEAK